MFDVQKSGLWRTYWQDLRDYINPYSGFFETDQPNYGDKRDTYMINTIPLEASNVLAAGMQDGITSPSRPWMRLTIPDPTLEENTAVKTWCDDVTQKILEIFSRSNFYDSAIEFYKELGVYGTAAMLVESDDEHGIWCRSFTIGEYAIGVDNRNRVNRFARDMRMTVAEMVSSFGVDNVPNDVKQCWDNHTLEKYFNIKHLVASNPNYIPNSEIKWAKQFISLYWAEGSEEESYLEIGGYDEFPFLVARWTTKGANIYGYSPGWYSLNDSKSLQAIDEDVHIGVKKQVDPPMVAPTDVMAAGGVNTLPNGVTYYNRTEGDNSIKQALQVNLDLADAQALKQEKAETIKRHFYVDLFRMLADIDKSNITAREIIERVQEKMSQIGPVLNRLQHEFLQPLIDRVFNIAMRDGLLPPPPEDLPPGLDIKIEYISTMATAQKMVGLTTIQQYLEYLGTVAQLNPDVLDKIDFDEMTDKYGDALAVSPSITRSDDVTAQIRQQKAEQMQMQQAMEQGTQLAQGAKTLSETNMDSNNALSALLGTGVQQ